jgi:hypothetical protein
MSGRNEINSMLVTVRKIQTMLQRFLTKYTRISDARFTSLINVIIKLPKKRANQNVYFSPVICNIINRSRDVNNDVITNQARRRRVCVQGQSCWLPV